MRSILVGAAIGVVLSACAPRAVIPTANQFAASTAEVGEAMLPKVEPLALADVARQRREALASGKALAPLPARCNAFFTVRQGAHFRDCPAEAPIKGFVLEPTVPTEALAMLRVYLAFGEAMGNLARSTAPDDTADAIAAFSANAEALAKELDADGAERLLAGANEKMVPVQTITKALLNAAKAQSLCRQMLIGRDAFVGAHQRLWVYTERNLDPPNSSQPHEYFDAKDSRPDVAEARYAEWKKAFPDSPFAALDAAAVAFEATLAACGARP
jgi:hypothetical protein